MKILVVDDEPLVRKSLSRVMQQRGHVVQEAADGIQGLRVWQEMSPDLVFLDVLMPGLSGPQVLAEMGERGKTRVILMSAFSGEHNLETAHHLGADLFIPKPFDDIFTIARVAEELFGKSPADHQD